MLTVNIYTDGTDCTNGGVSSKAKKLTVVNVKGWRKPSKELFEKCPPVKLINKSYTLFGNRFNNIILVPVDPETLEIDKSKRYMAGGNFGYTSDSRFNNLVRDLNDGYSMGAISIHDRVEYIP